MILIRWPPKYAKYSGLRKKIFSETGFYDDRSASRIINIERRSDVPCPNRVTDAVIDAKCPTPNIRGGSEVQVSILFAEKSPYFLGVIFAEPLFCEKCD